ncbi:M28 family peptidase [candidate division KSB1 bacterium]
MKKLRSMQKSFISRLVLLTVSSILVFGSLALYQDRCLIPADIREAVLNEISGEEQLRTVEMLGMNRNRQAEEYSGDLFETEYITKMAKQYGYSDVNVDYFPSGDTWDAEEADLWLIEPVRKKIASLEMVPAALASGSKSADVETEVVYIGRGRPQDLAGKNLSGKIVMGSSSVSGAFNTGVQQGAVGALGTGSSGVNANTPGYTLDQLGWQSVSVRDGQEGFGFVLSKRQFDEIRGYLDSGRRVVMKAHVKTRTYPYRMNVMSARIPGTDPNAKELVFVAHAFERIATPGANDNCSGVASTLEAGRAIIKLINNGDLPRPKRSIRFLWVPEISGTRNYYYKYPDLMDKILVAMNYDMSGQDLELTDTYLRMKMTPDSRPSYLNDLIADLLRYVDQTDIRTQWGNNAPFNYRLVPFISASDHTVFLNGGVAAMQFNHWADNFYHSSEDRAKYSDPTELKRTSFIGAAAFYYLANAGEEEAMNLAWECAANGDAWIAERTRQSVRLLDTDVDNIHERYKAAQNKAYWAAQRVKNTVKSVLNISNADKVESIVDDLSNTVDETLSANESRLQIAYNNKCEELGVRPQKIELSDREEELSKMVPRYLYKYYSQDYRTRSGSVNSNIPQGSPRLRGLSSSEVPNFIDGENSILDIYNAVRAEYGNVTTNNSEWKFAYVVTPETADIELDAVVNYINALEQAGLIEILNK